MSDTVTRRSGGLPAPLRALRPKQWVKNILVFTAPVASARVLEPGVLADTLLALLAFVMLSSAVYLINDARDVQEDRQHPTKRFRPIAAGDLAVRTALAMAAVLAVAALALGWWVEPALAVVLTFYAVLQLGYTLALKNHPVLDLAIVAIGFLLRAVAGAVANDIQLSQWFLLVASFGSLFMVAGKRYSEIVELGADSGTRPSLAAYTPTYLRFVWAMSAALVVMCYSLWAFDQRAGGLWDVPWAAISIGPFTLAIMSYARDIDAGRAGEPEDVVLSDRVLWVLGLLWLVTAGLGIVANRA